MDKLYLFLPFFLVAGYLFGQWTCSRRGKIGSGFYVTTVIFGLLNLVHSLVDGTMLRSLTSDAYSLTIMGGHEFIRQPLMYVFYFSAAAPFSVPMWQKVILGIFSVTGIWAIGITIGTHIRIPYTGLSDHDIGLCTYAFFGGDILHHAVDYVRYRRRLRAS